MTEMSISRWSVIAEVVSAVAVVLSLIYVGSEIRQNTITARASAIQQMGITTAEMWSEIGRDPALLRVVFKRSDIQLSEWTADDWSRTLAQMLAWSRLAETGLLQVSEGLLPPSSLELLGYSNTKYWLQNPAISCLWKYRLKERVSEDFASYVESGAEPVVVDCIGFLAFPFKSPAYINPNVSSSR